MNATEEKLNKYTKQMKIFYYMIHSALTETK